MAGASMLRGLRDADLEALHHMLRRDDKSDRGIAEWALKRLGRKGGTVEAMAMTVSRYRRGKVFARWLARWENQDRELRAKIELQKQRFEFVRDLTAGTEGDGLYAASKHLQARLLTLAAEASDEDLRGGELKWVRGLLTEIRENEKLERAAAGAKAAEIAGDTTKPLAARQAAIREIFGK